MRIGLPALEFTGTTNFSEHAANLVIDGQRIIQVVQHFRAANTEHTDRGNTTHVIEFDVTRTHADTDAAETYILTHTAACEAAAGGLVTLKTAAGSNIGTYTNGQLSGWRLVEHVGATTVFHYRLDCGGRT